MAVYEVTDYFDVWGNVVDGFEINDQRRSGKVLIRNNHLGDELAGDNWERHVVQRLIDKGELQEAALQAWLDGELVVVDQGDGSVELSETVHAYALENTETGRQRWGGETEAEAANEAEEGEVIQEVEDARPLYGLSPIDPERDDTVPFFQQKVETYGERFEGDDPEKLRAMLEFRSTKDFDGKVDVFVDDEFFGSRKFPGGMMGKDLGISIHGGVVHLDKGDDDGLIEQAQVALDAFLERGGEADPKFVPPTKRAPKGNVKKVKELKIGDRVKFPPDTYRPISNFSIDVSDMVGSVADVSDEMVSVRLDSAEYEDVLAEWENELQFMLSSAPGYSDDGDQEVEVIGFELLGRNAGEVEAALRARGLKVEPCGLNADWSVPAWHLSPGRPNRTPGDYYLLDNEQELRTTGRSDAASARFVPEFSVVQRTDTPEDENNEVDELATGMLEHVLDAFTSTYLATTGRSESGYAFELVIDPVRERWNDVNRNRWDQVVVDAQDFGEELGVTVINGHEMRVWRRRPRDGRA